ncbi:MurR/RpiR family transcriptional regulator [Irregularibacter muris]|uniref:MurR/RpiR family transcriptional regulator n=1 Tax=Irregularibacter muris TaxID=1796619 RepID=A0AAE3L0A4_9FIRM|nr:MurR/RpiR family transcriptional regulator [Irregularibacter muris]MCR1900016.1 MurR/RpiR family transcriptional regulator [Irregularibacter muris]
MIIDLQKEIYQNLSSTEKQVLKFLNNNEDKIPFLSITQIAKKSFTSSATVSRTIQKCGFSGINELRYKISTKKNKKELESPYVVNNILAKSYRECTKTIDNISSTSIFQTIEFMKNSRRIFIVARGFTALIAEEFQMYLQLLKYDAVIVKDVMWMKNIHKIVSNKDVVIILSLQNSTPELVETARTAKKCGAKIVICCCKTPTNLEKYSDVTIIGHTEEVMKAGGQTVYSRVPLLIITRTIIEYIGL